MCKFSFMKGSDQSTLGWPSAIYRTSNVFQHVLSDMSQMICMRISLLRRHLGFKLASLGLTSERVTTELHCLLCRCYVKMSQI